jgi:ParB-like chromosome segregation protein Spo0J
MKQSELAAEWVDIDSLKPWKENPRKNDGTVGKVVESIKRFGFGAPILARKADREIIAGHTRFAAAQVLGLRQVPVRLLDLDPAQAHLLALADNKIQEASGWDEDMLTAHLKSLSLGDALLAGWSTDDLSKLLKGAELPDGGAMLGDGLKYQVIVECDDELQQSDLLERLQSEGLRAKPLIS